MSVLLSSVVGCSQQQQTSATALKKTYVFWPSAPDEPRVQYLYSFNSSIDVQKAQSGFDEMLYGKREVLPIAKPYGVAMANGKIYACDVRTPGVTVLDLKGQQTRVVGIASGVGIKKALDIAIAPDGYKYVADASAHNIGVLAPDDKLLPAIAAKDFNPVSVAVYGDELYVADFTGQCIKVFNRTTGKYLRKIGEAGPEDGQFVRPITVRINPAGEVVTVDVLKCRVQKFTRQGAFISAFGRIGNNAGDLARPKHFSFDKNGFMYIADAAFQNVQIFDTEGKVVDYFGGAGDYPGSMDLPAGLFVDEDPADLELFKAYVHPAFQPERLILVTNQFGNHRVAIYAQGQLKPGKTLADLALSRRKIPDATTQPTTQPDINPNMPTPNDVPASRTPLPAGHQPVPMSHGAAPATMPVNANNVTGRGAAR